MKNGNLAVKVSSEVHAMTLIYCCIFYEYCCIPACPAPPIAKCKYTFSPLWNTKCCDRKWNVMNKDYCKNFLHMFCISGSVRGLHRLTADSEYSTDRIVISFPSWGSTHYKFSNKTLWVVLTFSHSTQKFANLFIPSRQVYHFSRATTARPASSTVFPVNPFPGSQYHPTQLTMVVTGASLPVVGEGDEMDGYCSDSEVWTDWTEIRLEKFQYGSESFLNYVVVPTN